jgi:hypothetical protein
VQQKLSDSFILVQNLGFKKICIKNTQNQNGIAEFKVATKLISLPKSLKSNFFLIYSNFNLLLYFHGLISQKIINGKLIQNVENLVKIFL